MSSKKRGKKNSKGVILIKKSNNLIESRYRFDIWETRFFLAVLAQINKQDDDFKVYRVWYKDVIKTFGLKSGDSYAYLREAAQSLMGKSFFVKYEEDGVKREKQYHILREIDYLQAGEEKNAPVNQEYIDVTVEQKMKLLLLQLKKNFTAYDLRNVVKLGVYPVRIYELLKQYQSIGRRTLKVNEIKEMLEVQELYKNFSDFYRWVIKPAIKQINEYTDLIITDHKKIKEGRKYTAIYFEFRTKEAEYMKLENDQKPISIDYKKAIFEELYLQVKQWIGVETFKKLLSKYPEHQIRTAISITQNRLNRGDVIDNVGGHIISLSKHKDLIDTKEVKKKEQLKKKQTAVDNAIKVQELKTQKKTLAREWSNKELAIIEMIFIDHPDMRTVFLDKAKQRFSNYQADKTVDENLQNPMFAATFRNIAKKHFPANFESLNTQYEKEIKTLDLLINELQ